MKADTVLPGIGHDLAKKFDTHAKMFDTDCSCSALGALVRAAPKLRPVNHLKLSFQFTELWVDPPL